MKVHTERERVMTCLLMTSDTFSLMMASIKALSPSTRSVSFHVSTESRMERYFSPSSRWEAPPVERAVNCERSVDTASEVEAGAGDDMTAGGDGCPPQLFQELDTVSALITFFTLIKKFVMKFSEQGLKLRSRIK